ncbi:MAG: exosome complex protein Rrp4 [Candidatus Thermoplasmatota archaeon]|nr:exosome complex protein Rrp4 [Candidatus Thermoplasmatota archaeon]
MSSPEPEVVVPGDVLDSEGLKPGVGTFSEGGQIYASLLGIKRERDGYLDVDPVGGRYIPREGDLVIGKVVDLGPSHWLVDLNGPHPSPLRVNEVPWKVDFGDTARYLDVEDAVLVKIISLDETKRVIITMKDRSTRKLTGGRIVEISHARVPRVIGREGSMISLIKSFTNTRTFVGQNGRIWIDGELDDVVHAVTAIEMIESDAHVHGLTDAVRDFLEATYGKAE